VPQQCMIHGQTFRVNLTSKKISDNNRGEPVLREKESKVIMVRSEILAKDDDRRAKMEDWVGSESRS